MKLTVFLERLTVLVWGARLNNCLAQSLGWIQSKIFSLQDSEATMDRGENNIHRKQANAARKQYVYKEKGGRGKGRKGRRRRWGKTSTAEGTERLRLRGRKSCSEGPESEGQPGPSGALFCHRPSWAEDGQSCLLARHPARHRNEFSTVSPLKEQLIRQTSCTVKSSRR